MAGPFKMFLSFTYTTLSSYTLTFDEEFEQNNTITPREIDNDDGTTTVELYTHALQYTLPTKIQFCDSVGLLKVEYVNTSHLTTMKDMFCNCSNLTEITGIEDWDVSNVTNMDSAFRGVGITELDLSKWDVSNVTTFCKLFYNCINLVSLDISNWNTKKVTDISYMFYECQQLESISLLDWDTSNVTNMSYLFYDCTKLPNLNLLNWDTKKVTDMSYMFYGCLGMTSIDISNWITSNVTKMDYMMYDCRNLKTVNLSGIKLAMISTMSNMLTGINCNMIDSILLYDSSFSAVNKIIQQLSNYNTDHIKKIYLSKRIDISKIDVVTANSKYWEVVQGDIIKVSSKGNLLLYDSSWLTLPIKRIYIGDTKRLKY